MFDTGGAGAVKTTQAKPGGFDTFGTALVASSLLQAGAGIFAYGAARDNASTQKEISKANASIDKTNVMKSYTELFKKEQDLLSTQKSIFAGANIGWKNSVYQEAMFNSEESFLRNKTNQKNDLAGIDSRAKIQGYSANSQKHGQQANAITGTTSNLLGNYTSYLAFGGGK